MKVVLVKKRSELLSLLLAVLMIFCVQSIEVSAAEESSVMEEVEPLLMVQQEKTWNDIQNNKNLRAMLYNCLISVNSSSDGMRVSFMTDCTQIASSVGVKDVVIKQKVWYGWKTVATSSGGYNTNDTTFMGTILYTNAIKGETYRITCTHYADADEYTEVKGELDVVFTY